MGKSFIEFEVKGLREIEQALKRLPIELERKVLRRAVLAGAGVIRDEARRLAPVRTGALRQNIVARYHKRKNGLVRYDVGIRKGRKGMDAYYASMVEFGTSPHIIRAKKKKALGVDGRFGSVVRHPGASARPFMRPAFDSKYNEAIDKVGQVVRRAVERHEVIYWKQRKGW